MKRLTRYAPHATIFCASGAIMILELTAGRLVARHLGMSLHTWTAIIAAIMGGMAAGNYLGGRWADRFRAAPALTLLFAAAAAASAALLPLNALLGEWTPLVALPWIPRILAHIVLLFFAPALVLGTIAPVAARLAIVHAEKEGRAVGGVFAAGVIGSIAGTFLSGYWLVLTFGVSAIVLVSAGTLALLGAAWAIAWMRGGDQAAVYSRPTPERAPREEKVSLRARISPALIVVMSNVAFMTIELAASRMLSREFGASLYTWTSLIGVALTGIALGNYAGGRLADASATARTLARLFVLASAATAVAPFCTEYIHRLFQAYALFGMLSWPSRILLYTAAAFFAPCFLLGFISPVVVKRALDHGWTAGNALGGIYAWGAAGGIAATLLTGYALIDLLGAAPTVYATALLLAVTALALTPRRKPAAIWTAYCLAALILASTPYPPLATLGGQLGLRREATPRILHDEETRYSYLAVVADPETPNIRSLTLDMLMHSQIDLDQPTRLYYEYEWVYDAVLETAHPKPEPITALIIGGGAYTYPRHLATTRPGGHVETAEIDPGVTRAAYDWFGLSHDLPLIIHNMDGRNRIADLIRQQATGETVPAFDCIFGDSVNDFSVPPHLTTLEFTQQLAALLNDDGIYMLNLIDLLDAGAFTASMLRTCREVFPCVAAFRTAAMTSVRDTIILVCSKRPLALDGVAERLRQERGFKGALLPKDVLDRLVAQKGVLLTDDYTPVEILLRPVVNTRAIDPAAYAFDRAKEALEHKRFEEARKECATALETHPDWPEAQELLRQLQTAQQ